MILLDFYQRAAANGVNNNTTTTAQIASWMRWIYRTHNNPWLVKTFAVPPVPLKKKGRR